MKKTLAMIAVATILTTGVQPASAGGTITIGYPPSIDMLPALVAHENGCLSRAGYESNLTLIPIATNIPPATLSGSLQIGMSTPTILLPAVENGLDLVAIAGSSIMKKGNEGVSAVTRPGLGVTSAEHFKGKKVGVPGLLSVADIVFRKWLKVKGVDPTEVTFVEVPFPRMADMMKAATVDAVLAVEPVLSGLVAAGLAERKAGEYYSEIADDAMITLWTATGEWAKANPEAVKAFAACLDESIDWIGKNRDAAGEISKKYLKFNPTYTPAWRTEIKPEHFAFFIGIGREFDLLRTDLDAAKLLVAP